MQTASDVIQEKTYQQGRVDAIDEFYNRLIKNKSSMNQANYPWNYVEVVYKEMKGAINE